MYIYPFLKAGLVISSFYLERVISSSGVNGFPLLQYNVSQELYVILSHETYRCEKDIHSFKVWYMLCSYGRMWLSPTSGRQIISSLSSGLLVAKDLMATTVTENQICTSNRSSWLQIAGIFFSVCKDEEFTKYLKNEKNCSFIIHS